MRLPVDGGNILSDYVTCHDALFGGQQAACFGKAEHDLSAEAGQFPVYHARHGVLLIENYRDAADQCCKYAGDTGITANTHNQMRGFALPV